MCLPSSILWLEDCPRFMAVNLSVSRFVCPSIRPSVCLSVSLSPSHLWQRNVTAATESVVYLCCECCVASRFSWPNETNVFQIQTKKVLRTRGKCQSGSNRARLCKSHAIGIYLSFITPPTPQPPTRARGSRNTCGQRVEP